MNSITKKLFTFQAFMLASVIAFAQDNGADLDINITKDNGGDWYAKPWVWVIGGAVFLLLIIALVRGGGNKN